MKTINSLLLLLLLCPMFLFAQKYTVRGYVMDASSSETMISATVYDEINQRGTATNPYGFYTITLPKGENRLRFSYVGYSTRTILLNLTSDTVLNVKLLSSNVLDEVEVVSQRSQMGVEGSQMSAIEVPIQFIKGIPAIGGEIDIVKALQLLPGVQSGGEGQTGLYVRGGGPDENLILLDGVPLYNINHMGGMFSVFNADAIKNVTLYKGNFPSRFGGRLSSVIDVRQKDGDAQNYHGALTIGLLSAKLNVEGPIWKDHTTFNVSARRTHFDWFIPIFYGVGTPTVGSPLREYMGYSFWDVNAKVSHKFSDTDRLSASFYMGDDYMYSNVTEKLDTYTAKSKKNWTWGNLVSSLNWTHVYSPQLFSNAIVSYTRYRFRLGVKMDEKNTNPNDYVDSHYDMDYNSNIEDITAQYNFDYKPHHAHDIKFGAQYTFHIFKPTVTSIYQQAFDTLTTNSMDTTYGDTPTYTHEAALYVEDNWDIHRRLRMNIGLRGSIYSVAGKVYPSLEPRVGLRILLMDDLSFKASYQYVTQYLHLLSSSNVTLPIDLWVPVTANIPPMHSHQVAGGFFYNLMDLVDFSVEGYYKTMDNVLEYKDGASFVSSTTGWEEKVNVGRGWSYGVEFLAQRTIGKFTGWVGYTWSKTERKFDRKGMEINKGEVFPARYDRTHDLSLTLQYRPIKLIDLSATFIYGTGACGTLATQIAPNGESFITKRYNYRMPDYHRLDLGINFHFDRPKGRQGEHLLNISVYNAYNHQNPYYVYVGVDSDNSDKPALCQVSLFPILPSISYTFKF
ncbi:MAG: TonB-dependent receptor [Paludibacteraceae bacterium]|nr:TonB-dependent receptor [Paludibacteraceae bacterium]